MSFEDLGLSKKTIKAVYEQDIFIPSEIQQQVIPAILQGKDLSITSPSGCGKTLSYIFPLIDIVNDRSKKNTVLILTPSSKDAIVVSERFVDYSAYHARNKRHYHKPANVIISSPDLFLEICAQNGVDVRRISILIIDDINEIKKQKKFADLEKAIDLLPKEKQTVIYTSRKSKEIDNLQKELLNEPLTIRVKSSKKGYFEIPEEKPVAIELQKKTTKEEKPTKAKKTPKKKENKEVKAKVEEEIIQTVIPTDLNELTPDQEKANSFDGLVPDFMRRTGITA